MRSTEPCSSLHELREVGYTRFQIMDAGFYHDVTPAGGAAMAARARPGLRAAVHGASSSRGSPVTKVKTVYSGLVLVIVECV